VVKNPHIVAVRFIGLFIKASFVNETSTKNHFISRLIESLLQKEEEKGLTSGAVACDALYDSLSNRVNLEKRGMKPYIPEKRENKRVSNFIYSEKEDTLICPEGYSSIGKTRQEDGYLYYFSSDTCSLCGRREECINHKNRGQVWGS